MTTAVADPLAVADAGVVPRSGGDVTLDELVTGIWEDLALRGRAACPVCGEAMQRGAGAPGRCGGCASELD